MVKRKDTIPGLVQVAKVAVIDEIFNRCKHGLKGVFSRGGSDLVEL
jgi:hypothetical protein